jgi:hypothetical protein
LNNHDEVSQELDFAFGHVDWDFGIFVVCQGYFVGSNQTLYS